MLEGGLQGRRGRVAALSSLLDLGVARRLVPDREFLFSLSFSRKGLRHQAGGWRGRVHREADV